MIKEINEKVLEIKEVTLLSIEEAKLAEENIPGILASTGETWWLRPSSDYDYNAAHVDVDDTIYLDGDLVSYNFGVRPALRIDNLESNHLQIGDKIQIAHHSWTVISDDLVLCDEIITREPFNPAKTRGNDYESSHIKEFVTKWGKNMQLTSFKQS